MDARVKPAHDELRKTSVRITSSSRERAFAAARAGWSDPCIFLFFCRFGVFHPRSHDLKHTHTSSFPRRISAPGVCTFASPTPSRGVGGAPRNVRVLSGTPVRRIMTRYARRPARRLASHDAGRSPLGAPPWRFWAPGAALSSPAFAPDRAQRAPRTQVVVPGGRGPCLPGRAVTSRLPQDATPRSAFRIVSGDAPQ
jgi:hypothetical protein